MKRSMILVGGGAVTSVGLDAPQSLAAIRAGLSGFRRLALLPPPNGPVTVARVPAADRLRYPAAAWLSRLASRAIGECLRTSSIRGERTLLVVAVPQRRPAHDAWLSDDPERFLDALQAMLNTRFHPASSIIREGHASAFAGLAKARELMDRGEVEHAIVGGVDSMVNRLDIERLAAVGRLHGDLNPQGLIPGEGACFVLACREGAQQREAALGRLAGLGFGHERATVHGDEYSSGEALRAALRDALADAGTDEPAVGFRVSDANGERYRAWESAICAMRSYRTRRDRIPTFLPASFTGDLGAASGALSILAAAHAIARGHAAGPLGVCESSSDGGLRGAAVILPAVGAPVPPFYSRAQAARLTPA